MGVCQINHGLIIVKNHCEKSMEDWVYPHFWVYVQKCPCRCQLRLPTTKTPRTSFSSGALSKLGDFFGLQLWHMAKETANSDSKIFMDF